MESKRGEKRMGIRKKHVNEFPTPYTCTAAIREGGMETKLSMVLMGFGNIMHKQKIKGLIYLAVEVAYVVFMNPFPLHAWDTGNSRTKRGMG